MPFVVQFEDGRYAPEEVCTPPRKGLEFARVFTSRNDAEMRVARSLGRRGLILEVAVVVVDWSE